MRTPNNRHQEPARPCRFRWPGSPDGAEVEVEVRWNARRRSRVGIAFNSSGGLVVDAPPSTTMDEVRGVLERHRRWIRNRGRALEENGGPGYPAEYESGALLLYRGRALELRLSSDAQVWLGHAHLTAPAGDAKGEVWRWYARQADGVLGHTLANASTRLPWVGDAPRWRHHFMSSRWGSCSPRGRISLNTHLVKLPDALIEYVVVHELCHLRHLNHGPGFHRLMDASLPNWQACRQRLNAHAGLLSETPPARVG